jgi:tRNA pseudouridine38-40 synthase
LPKGIAILNLRQVKPDAHARFDPISRTYKYFIHRRKDPFLEDFSHYLYGLLDIEAMNEAAQIMLRFIDFTSFSKLHTQTKTNDCKISEAVWEERDHQLIFTITADRFLRNMVRAIVGTMLEVGQHKITVEDFKKVIENKNRSEAGYSVPAKALFLYEVEYPEKIFFEKD